MKMIIEARNGWCGQIVRCLNCFTEFTVIRQRGIPPQDSHCPVCNGTGSNIVALEYPWIGKLEVNVNDECTAETQGDVDRPV